MDDAESVTRKLSTEPFGSVVPDFLHEEKKLTNPMQAMLRNKTFFINNFLGLENMNYFQKKLIVFKKMITS
jgi:hypothetical protein